MPEARLKAGLFVRALLRRCTVEGAFGAVLFKGDEEAGTVLLKINALENGCVVLTPCRTGDGAPAWMRGTGETAVAEAEADAYIERQRRIDPDLWAVEIEDRQGRLFVEGPIL